MFKLLFISLLMTLPQISMADPEVNISGYGRGWIQLSEDEMNELNHALVGRVRLEGSVKLDKCVKLNARLNTGNSFNSENFYTGVGYKEAELNVDLRHLYVDIQCAKSALSVELGALPTNDDTRIGNLGISNNGWIDGIRVSKSSEDGKTIWVFSAGSVQDFKNPNLFTRDRSEINHIDIGHQRPVTDELSAGAVVGRFDEVYFTRLVLEYSASKLAKWLDTISLEGMTRDKDFVGYHLRTKVVIGGWDFNLINTHVDQNLNDERKYSLLIKDFYGFGDNYYLVVDKELSAGRSAFARGRVGDAGPRFELGMTQKF